MTSAQALALFKTMEEASELATIAAKLGMYPDGNHPSTKFNGEPIWQEVANEIADVRAACVYLLQQFPEIPIAGIEARKQEKLRLYEEWAVEKEYRL